MLSRDTPGQRCVFLVDVDNTLFDNDRFAADLGACLQDELGAGGRDRYWQIYEALRDEVGYADYFGALQRLRIELEAEPAILQLGEWILAYDYAGNLYPQALEAVAHLQALGTTAILSDGDAVLQPHKIRRSGLWEALHGEVMVFVHKQDMLAAVQARYPASHYVMVDDKAQVLAQMKQRMGARLTTVFVRQGHYAQQAGPDIKPAPDLQVERIGDIRGFAPDDFGRAAAAVPLADI
ncbi:MAG TPA: HAD family hydrolase [Rhodanobacter sp.]|jgi:FMN phosphatase YigB (HAD superfamily)|nr:HAD family hydrolase [Rhodanobacter sp.]